MNPELPFRLFDPEADVTIVDRRLPHWSQAGTVCFITWRSIDSIPKQVLDQWRREREEWLLAHGIDPERPDWRERLLRELDEPTAREFRDTFWNRWHDHLDAGHGECVLREPEVAEIVADSLHHFNEERYLLLDFVVMPNHVHLLVAFPDEEAMLAQCDSWKHFTATKINRRFKQKGKFWQTDAFDQLLRSEEQFQYLRRYIADNPQKAGLKPGEFAHFSKRLPN